MAEDEVVIELLKKGARVSLLGDFPFLSGISSFGENIGVTKKPGCIKKIIQALAKKFKLRKKNRVVVSD